MILLATGLGRQVDVGRQLQANLLGRRELQADGAHGRFDVLDVLLHELIALPLLEAMLDRVSVDRAAEWRFASATCSK